VKLRTNGTRHRHHPHQLRRVRGAQWCPPVPSRGPPSCPPRNKPHSTPLFTSSFRLSKGTRRTPTDRASSSPLSRRLSS
jgi:hypothetical protein